MDRPPSVGELVVLRRPTGHPPDGFVVLAIGGGRSILFFYCASPSGCASSLAFRRLDQLTSLLSSQRRHCLRDAGWTRSRQATGQAFRKPGPGELKDAKRVARVNLKTRDEAGPEKERQVKMITSAPSGWSSRPATPPPCTHGAARPTPQMEGGQDGPRTVSGTPGLHPLARLTVPRRMWRGCRTVTPGLWL